MSASKICRICFSFNSTSQISKARRSGASYRRFCSEINYNHEDELDQGNVTICGECMPLVESVSTSKCRLEEIEGQVLKLQQKLLKILSELEEELEDHSKDMERLEEIVKGSTPRKEVFERFKEHEVDKMMEFRKGIIEVAQDLRAFRTNNQGKIVSSSPQQLIKLERQLEYSPTGSPVVEDSFDYDQLGSPDDDVPLTASPKQKKPLRTSSSSSNSSELDMSSADSEDNDDEPPPKRRKGGLEFLKGCKGKDQLVYKGHRYILRRSSGAKTFWDCALAKQNRCHAIIHTADDEVIAIKGKHNHPTDPAKIEAIKIINKIKEAGVSKGASIKSIVAKEAADGGVDKLPSVQSIARMMHFRNQKRDPTPSSRPPISPDEFDTDLSGTVEFVKRNRGKDHLVFKGHRFCQNSGKYWTCVQRTTSGCRAYINNVNNVVTRYRNIHNHSPIDHGDIEDINLAASSSTTTSARESVTGNADNATEVSVTVVAKHPTTSFKVQEPILPLEYVKSAMGKDHLLYEGYRYSTRSDKSEREKSIWRCAFLRTNRCRALLNIKNGRIVQYNKQHNHPPESADKIEAKKLMTKLKETCLTSEDKPSELLAGAQLGPIKFDTAKAILYHTRKRAKSRVTSENARDRIISRNPEIFLMGEFMQEVVIAMITKEEQRHSRKSKGFDPGLNYSFRFDWNEKRIFLGDVEVIVNENAKLLQCSQCQKRIGSDRTCVLATQIFDHIVGKHFDAYKCPVCTERLTAYKNFQLHLGLHADPEVSCDICGKSVARGSLQRHRVTHMSQEEKKMARKEIKYFCSICGKSFSDKGTVRRHERRSHL